MNTPGYLVWIWFVWIRRFIWNCFGLTVGPGSEFDLQGVFWLGRAWAGLYFGYSDTPLCPYMPAIAVRKQEIFLSLKSIRPSGLHCSSRINSFTFLGSILHRSATADVHAVIRFRMGGYKTQTRPAHADGPAHVKTITVMWAILITCCNRYSAIYIQLYSRNNRRAVIGFCYSFRL